MGRKKVEDMYVRKLGKAGGGASIGVTLPIDIVRALRWRDNQKVVMKKYGQGIIITDWQPDKKRRKSS